MLMNEFLKNIHLKNKFEIIKFAKSVVSSSTSLKDFFQEIFIIVASYKDVKLNNQNFYDHPLIDLNSLKNIASLNLKNPSYEIVLKAIDVLLNIPSQKINLKNKKVEIDSQMLNSPLLTNIFIKSVLQNNHKTAKLEASKIIAMSDNPISVLEVLMELSIPNFNLLGPLTYSIYRSGRFANSEFMIFINILIESNITFNYEKNLNKVDTDPIVFFPILNEENQNFNSLVLYAIGLRLWNYESPRQLNFQNNIISFFEKNFKVNQNKNNQFKVSKKSVNSLIEGLDKKDPILISSFLYHSKSSSTWNWPVELVMRYDNNSNMTHKYLFIDSIQFLIKNLNNDYLFLLSEYLISFDKHLSK